MAKMKNDEVIDGLKNLIHFYELFNNENSAYNKEINMWRNRFLDEKIKGNDSKSMYIKNVFLGMPYDNFMKNTPEENLILLDRCIFPT